MEPIAIGSQARGRPEPSTLAALGWVLAFSVFVVVGLGRGPESRWFVVAVLAMPILRLAWFVWSLVKYRSHGTAWTKRERDILIVAIYINCTLILLDAVLVVVVGASTFVFSTYNFSN